jgi:hypothetical protein
MQGGDPSASSNAKIPSDQTSISFPYGIPRMSSDAIQYGVPHTVFYSAEASQCTAKQLTQLAEILPEGAQVDMVLATDSTLAALGACADILAQGLDVDYYCQDPDWKNVIEIWKNKHIQASCRKEDADGLDAENVGFLNLALQEVRQTVTEEIQAWMMGVAAMAEMDQ